MTSLLRQIGVIARRDFLSIVGTPTFLIFLLAPMFMIAVSIVGGQGAARLGESSASKARIAAIADAPTGRLYAQADALLRAGTGSNAPELMVVAPSARRDLQTAALFASKDVDVTAVMYGAVSRPLIRFKPPSDRDASYLAFLAESVARAGKAGIAVDAKLSQPRIVATSAVAATRGGQQASGFGAVFVIFFLTLLLAGQTVSTLAEERGNKVIEILAAAVRLEAVFLGKLIGLFGVAVVFVAFWSTIGTIALLAGGSNLTTVTPAVGLPVFLILCGCYFSTAYFLLGAVFLGIGAQASSMREIQLMSLPITIFQVAMFGVSSAAASSPGSTIARFAEIFPFSSPFAMAARAATDAALWPHVLALAWQVLWVLITVSIGVRMFTLGVLKSGGGWRGLFRRAARS